METKVVLEVYIKPHAKKTLLSWDKDLQKFVAYVKSPPQKGKANREVTSLIKEFFKAEEVKLLKGQTSTTKIFELKGVKSHVQDLVQAKIS